MFGKKKKSSQQLIKPLLAQTDPNIAKQESRRFQPPPTAQEQPLRARKWVRHSALQFTANPELSGGADLDLTCISHFSTA